MSQQVGARDVVVDTTYHAASVARSDDVFLNAHEDLGLCTCLLALDDVQVHLVTVEVCVVGRAIS